MAQFKPTGFDHPMGEFSSFEGKENWLVAPCGVNRDSGLLTECNWEAQKRALETAQATNGSAESEEADYEIHRIGHWACGWYEVAIVRPESACHTVAAEIACALEGYPVLDESAYSDAQFEARASSWANLSVRARYELIKRKGSCSIFAARRDSVPDDSAIEETLDGWNE